MTLEKVEEKGYTYYKEPPYADVPYAEYRQRIEKAQGLMSENNVDCLLLWSKPNIRYFFGFQTIHWLIPSIQPAVGIIPSEGEPVLVVPDFFRAIVEGHCWVKDIRGQKDPHQPKSERELPVEIAGVVKELGYEEKNIGLEKGALGCMWIPRPLNDIQTLISSLPGADWVDGDQVIWGCRMIKSPLEIDRITTSINAIAMVQLALVEEFRPGMSETDISRISQRAAAELGIGFIGDCVGLQGSFRGAYEKEPMVDIGIHEGGTIGKGDNIFFDMFFDYKGYKPDNARIFQVSPATDEMKRYYELIWECEDSAGAALKPGAKAKEVWGAMYAPIEAAGLPVLDMGGHGTGLDTHEPPSIDAWNEMEIKEGMVISIEPWVLGSYRQYGGVGKFGIQDQFVVTDKGSSKISALRRDIIETSQLII
jgi:Xaa-Pro aminopeptidase